MGRVCNSGGFQTRSERVADGDWTINKNIVKNWAIYINNVQNLQRTGVASSFHLATTTCIHLQSNHRQTSYCDVLIIPWQLLVFLNHAHTHTHPFNGSFPLLPRWAGTRKVKPIWILLKQETVNGSDISWAICKSAPRSRQITTLAPHHSVFTGRMPFLPPNQQCQSTEGISIFSIFKPCSYTQFCTILIF